MKKLFAIIMAVVCLFGCCVFTAAAEQNNCDVFEFETNCMRYFQSSSVALGGQFDALAIVCYTMQRMDVSAYLQEGTDLEYHIPGAVFEQAAMTHFAVTVAQLRALRLDDTSIYNADNQEYWVRERNNAGSETYFIRGYEKSGSRYTVYFNYVDGNYQIQPGDVEGVQYLLDWDTDIYGQPTEPQPVKLLDEKIKVTVEYDGENMKFLAWEHINVIPDLSGMTTPTKPDVSTIATTTGDGNHTGTTTAAGTGDTLSSTTTGKTGDSNQIGGTSTATGSTSATRTTIKDGRVTTSGDGLTAVRTTIPTVPLRTLLQTDTVIMKAPDGALPKNASVTVTAVTVGSTFNTARRALGDIAERFVLYEITATSDNKTVQPTGEITATFDIPEGYEPNHTAIVYITPGGAAEVLVSKVDKTAGTVTAELSHFSTYAVAELYTADIARGPNVLIIVLAVVGVALLIGGAAYMYNRKKAAYAEDTSEEAASEQRIDE